MDNQKGRKRFFAGGAAVGFLGGVLASIGLIAAGGSGFAGVIPGRSGHTSALNEGAVGKLRVLENFIDENYYYNDEVSTEQKEDGLYKGLLESLHDPYSVYYTAQEYKALTEDTEGIYYGIGAYISRKEGSDYPLISGVIPGTPAEESGLLKGDLIYKVDGESMEGLTIEEVVSRVKGPEGTVVHLELIREKETEPVEKDVDRRQIDSPTVSGKMLPEQIGYIQVSEFDTVTTEQFRSKLKELEDQNMKGLIIDLRDNPGGNVGTVTEMAGMILPEGLVFYMEDKNGERMDYTCPGADFHLPLVVLVNEYSASASEIFSGAVQDAEIGTIVGTRTYGKGVVQTIYSLHDETAVKLTIASYYTRGGQNINKVGIKPDVEEALDKEAFLKDGTDTQLNRALEVLKTEMTK